VASSRLLRASNAVDGIVIVNALSIVFDLALLLAVRPFALEFPLDSGFH
jgi:hypothetical protein